jgi:branched-chain amino acid transport system substrate-binding protein
VQRPINSNEIVIGVAGPMDADWYYFGKQEQAGVEMAIAKINATGGLLGKKLSMVSGDDHCDATNAATVANDLVNAGASVVVGHFCSAASLAAAEIYAEHGVVQITPSSTKPSLTDTAAAKGWTTLFRMGNRDEQQAIFAADWLAKTYPKGKIAVLSDGRDYGDLIAKQLIDRLHSKNVTPTLTENYDAAATDFYQLIVRLKQSSLDAVYIGGYHNNFGRIVQQARDEHIQATFIGGDALNTSEFSKYAGLATEGVRFTDVSDPVALPSAAKVVADFHAANKDPNGFALASYAAVQAWATGVARAGSLDASKVAAAIRSAPIDTVIGKLSWDAKGDIEQMRYAWHVWHGDTISQEP